MTCEECVHYDVCDYLPCETINLYDDMEERCEYIKDKSKFREVVHGKWIKHIDDLFIVDSTCECSVCHEEQPLYLCDDNYCPNCGADMRGEQK